MQDAQSEGYGRARTRKVHWTERNAQEWRGTTPSFDMWYNADPENCLLYKVFAEAPRVAGKQVWTEQALQDCFERELVEGGVCTSMDNSMDDWMDKKNLANPWQLRRTGVTTPGGYGKK